VITGRLDVNYLRHARLMSATRPHSTLAGKTLQCAAVTESEPASRIVQRFPGT
jgi:hypothetical protein